MACGTVQAQVDYLKRLPLYQSEKPFQLFIPIEPDAKDQRHSNLEFEPKECTFHDVRDQLPECLLDSQGFQVLRRPTRLDPASFDKREIVESQYLDEVKDILKSVDGGYDRIFIFDWRVSLACPPNQAVAGHEFDMNDLTTWLRPSPTAHVDQSDRAVLHRIMLHLPDEAPLLLQGRVRIVNVWRPLEHVIEDYPLAFCDPTSVPDADLIECDHIRRKFKGANLYAHHSEEHKWCYVGNHEPDEVLLLKMFDSDSSVAAKRLLHASFRHPSAPADCKPRKSIEVRALLFNHPGQ
ncbi:methyltransferase CmcJ [Microdochium trichocladiopsis]|uniref:Methyltransferase CmcJ n=1 Tax=Microdochium trichocladiopsis TaxID=1682393 RepID=A0A9P9BS89_9PEZI|nr:methyltransferase CmcJ [Microdochium trichocladiopsis]KAH7028075.1 methyltransferase CmcJ [Microdochium trichocladiopsis]